MPEDYRDSGFGLYVHWPFCEAKCPYCDFNSYVSRSIDHAAWRAAYVSEIHRVAQETPGRVLNSIFFGGGTPSLMEPATVQAVIDTACRLWTPANDIEITLEANPSSVEADRFNDYHAAGVNRVSLGVQALNNPDLKRLGRLHSVEDAFAAIEIAQNVFGRTSFDLIYARQDQTPDAWAAELSQALSLGTEHLSLYQLTIEPQTAFGDRYKAGTLRGLPDEDRAVALFDLTQDMTQAAGFHRYEVSNHASPTAQSRHNLIYWRYGDYVGIGPGAHGRLTIGGLRLATETPLSPIEWLKGATSGNGESSRVSLSSTEAADEFLLMGLRLTEGIDMTRYAAISGQRLNQDVVRELTDLGFITASDRNLSVTNQGLKLLNAVLDRLITSH